MRQSALSFTGPRGRALDGVLTLPEGVARPPVVVLCPAHPALGGGMGHPLLVAVAGALAREGIASLRFAFGERGEGPPSGEGEVGDIGAALALVRRWPGLDGKRLGLMGHSWGASLVLQAFPRWKGVRAFALLSPPVRALEGSPFGRDTRPRLVLAGGQDRLVSAEQVAEALRRFPSPPRFHLVPEADHGWRGAEEEGARLTARFFAEAL